MRSAGRTGAYNSVIIRQSFTWPLSLGTLRTNNWANWGKLICGLNTLKFEFGGKNEKRFKFSKECLGRAEKKPSFDSKKKVRVQHGQAQRCALGEC